ncbi:MAG: nucleoside phosphatase [Desulfobacterales bacterium]|nr:nucleoside phosphatase [Desulfobacterales bacterium]
MISKISKISLFIIFLFTISSCSRCITPTLPDKVSEDSSSCYIIFDAGSSGTRLYIYEKQGTDWKSHEGPEVSALADPVREIRDKSWKDADAVTDEVVSALDAIKQDGPIGENGGHEWKAFDWEEHNVISAKVYATAGMRIAEQENRDRSAELWKKLEQKLAARLPGSVEIDTRTLSGYEEGLYAWLAVREKKKSNDFGIVEMGGASSQITFPCSECDAANDAVKTIMIGDVPLQIYSYSFLGLGQDEAPESLGFPESCAYGIGMIQVDWKIETCSDRISVRDSQGIRDPYNFGGKKRGTHIRIPTRQSDIEKWVLTGAFKYMKDSNIKTCCSGKGKCVNEKISCFRAVYLKKYLKELNVSSSSEKIDASWTSGAAVCEADDCLQQTTMPVCRWSNEGCLD